MNPKAFQFIAAFIIMVALVAIVNKANQSNEADKAQVALLQAELFNLKRSSEAKLIELNTRINTMRAIASTTPEAELFDALAALEDNQVERAQEKILAFSGKYPERQTEPEIQKLSTAIAERYQRYREAQMRPDEQSLATPCHKEQYENCLIKGALVPKGTDLPEFCAMQAVLACTR